VGGSEGRNAGGSSNCPSQFHAESVPRMRQECVPIIITPEECSNPGCGRPGYLLESSSRWKLLFASQKNPEAKEIWQVFDSSGRSQARPRFARRAAHDTRSEWPRGPYDRYIGICRYAEENTPSTTRERQGGDGFSRAWPLDTRVGTFRVMISSLKILLAEGSSLSDRCQSPFGGTG
jgi:hypothetical protein